MPTTPTETPTTGTISITPRQYSRIADAISRYNETEQLLKLLKEQRDAVVELLIDSQPELRGKNVKLKTPFKPDGIDYEIVQEPPKEG